MEITYLPPELIRETLSRLPVRSLLRFRCVSNPFCSTIDGDDFVKHHFSQSLKNNVNFSLVFTCADIVFYQYDSLENPVLIENPLKTGPNAKDSFYPIGFCNGLICLERTDGYTAFLNIATRKHRILPCFEDGIHYFQMFGYDPSIHDYKLIRVFRTKVMVYSLKENAWRKLKKGFPYPFAISLLGCQMVMRFGLSTEEFDEVPLPDSLLPNENYLYLAMLGEFLCVASYCVQGPATTDIWVMKDYGIKDSWTKLFSLFLPQDRLMGSIPKVVPVAYSLNRDNILLKIITGYTGSSQSTTLVWYDLKEKKIDMLGKLNETLPTYFYGGTIVETLVSLEVVQEKKKEQQTRVAQVFIFV
ncbi:F-box protein CPR1-like [Rutidosis leptorrhynchoides]|uniref:F-box protein CPR1-like n=1 Tax=Rutidosis leptorrhynchoides TaxID=125765 RepID=UPI003A992A3A